MQEQVRLLLTRIGEKSKIVVVGDVNQADAGNDNGLVDALSRFDDLDGIAQVELTEDSLIRNPIIAQIEKRYMSGPIIKKSKGVT